MCQRCKDLVVTLQTNGFTEEEAVDLLWERTPFSVGEPSDDQFEELSKLTSNRTKGVTIPENGLLEWKDWSELLDRDFPNTHPELKSFIARQILVYEMRATQKERERIETLVALAVEKERERTIAIIDA